MFCLSVSGAECPLRRAPLGFLGGVRQTGDVSGFVHLQEGKKLLPLLARLWVKTCD